MTLLSSRQTFVILSLLLLLSVGFNAYTLWVIESNSILDMPTATNRIRLNEADGQSDVFLGSAIRSAAMAEVEADFTIGLATALRGLPTLCRTLRHRSYYFCAEGEAYAQTYTLLTSSSSHLDPKKALSELPEKQMGVGMALSSVGMGRLQEFLQASSTLRLQKYLVDGWGFSTGLKIGPNDAMASCRREVSTELQNYCFWGVGRSTWFLQNALRSGEDFGDSALRVGRGFARRFAGGFTELVQDGRPENVVRRTMQVADLLDGKSSLNETGAKALVRCLFENHFYDCVTLPTSESDRVNQ